MRFHLLPVGAQPDKSVVWAVTALSAICDFPMPPTPESTKHLESLSSARHCSHLVRLVSSFVIVFTALVLHPGDSRRVADAIRSIEGASGVNCLNAK